jgi:hypothetical protein
MEGASPMKRLHLPLVLFLVLFASGCGRAGFGVAMFATGMIVGAASHSHPHRTHVTYVEVDAPPRTVVVVPAASPRDAVPPAPPPSFDPINARNALATVNLSTCRNEGAPSVHGHANVTYVPGGTISKVLIDQPAGLSLSAVTCIGRELGTARIEAFKGAEVTVGTSFFVP